MAKFDVNVNGTQLEVALDALHARADNMLPVFQIVGRKVKTRVQGGFRDSRTPWGDQWKPIKFRRGKPLLDTGRLRNSIVANPTGEHVDIGTNVKYGPYHQFGTGGRKADSSRMQAVNGKGRFLSREKASKRKRGAIGLRFLSFKAGTGGIPARPFLPVLKSGVTDLPTGWERDVITAMRQHFGKGLGR